MKKKDEEKIQEVNRRMQAEAELKELRDQSTHSSTLKRKSTILEGSIAEEGQSISDINPLNDRLAYRVRKTSTPIEKGNYENLKIFKPAFQSPENKRIQVFGGENDKTTKTIMVIGAQNRGRKTFINTLVNHLWDVKIAADRLRFKVVFGDGEATVYTLNDSKLDYNVSIVDIPGFEEHDDPRDILESVVSNCKKLDQSKFHALCFVVRAYDIKLSDTEGEILSVLPRLFQKDPVVNIMASFSDASEPSVKHALINQDIKFHNLFKVNTIFVESGSTNFDQFFEYLDSSNQHTTLQHDSALDHIQETFESKEAAAEEKKRKKRWLPTWFPFNKVRSGRPSSRVEEQSRRQRSSKSVPRHKTKQKHQIRSRSESSSR